VKKKHFIFIIQNKNNNRKDIKEIKKIKVSKKNMNQGLQSGRRSRVPTSHKIKTFVMLICKLMMQEKQKISHPFSLTNNIVNDTTFACNRSGKILIFFTSKIGTYGVIQFFNT